MLERSRIVNVLADIYLTMLTGKHILVIVGKQPLSKEYIMSSESADLTMKKLASEGGKARAAALTNQERSDIAKKAADARWALPRATHEGELELGGIKIPCANLDNGLRVLTQSGFMVALGRARQAKGRQYYDGDVNMPAFLTAKNLKRFVPKDLAVTSSQVEFRTLKGTKAFGYPAELLPKVCYVFLDAKEASELSGNQEHIAIRAKILARGLAHVGIIALVDEATGYQDVRDRLALQEILDQYLRKEFAAWAKKFPDEFYKEIFRLRGWKWYGMKINRPQCVASYTTEIVYSRLAPGLVMELQKRNPVLDSGRRKGRHHQLLTDEIGDPALAQHLYGVIGLMRTCDDKDWAGFMKLLNRAYPKKEDRPLFKNLEF